MKTTAATNDYGAGPPRFVRRTTLGANEYRRNFHQVDHEAIAAVTSEGADRVTSLMSKIYLRLVSAPAEFWEREGVLYFAAGDEGGRPIKASKVLYGLLGVASATAHKALQWMHGQGIIGYYAGKNGVGIRIFLNRATESIGVRTAAAGKKILPFARGSNGRGLGSSAEPAFNDSFAVSEVSETDITPRAPKSGAEKTEVVKKYPDPRPTSFSMTPRAAGGSEDAPGLAAPQVEIPVGEIVLRLSRELEPTLQAAAERAAAREHERTREWLESRGLPKAARVAQRESYNVLRKYGLINEGAGNSWTRVGAGRDESTSVVPRPLTDEEVEEMAQACLAMLEVQGQSIEVTLSQMGAACGGELRPEDAPRVRERATLLLKGSEIDVH